MAKLTYLPVELIEGIMDAAHPMPHGNIDSRHEEQRPAAFTFGAMRLVCRELNDKVFKRYVETLFSVHTVMLEELSLRTLVDMGKTDHFRNALGTLFIDTRLITYDLPLSAPEEDKNWLHGLINEQDSPGISISFLQILTIFPNLKEITIEHITVMKNWSSQPQMACMGAGAIQKRLGRRASIRASFGEAESALRSSLDIIFMALTTMKKELIDLQIRFVCREYAITRADHIEWKCLEQTTHEACFTTDYLDMLMQHSDYENIEIVLQGLTTLALPIRGPLSDDFDEDTFGPPEDWPFGDFEPTVLAKFISLSPKLKDLTVFFATGDEQAFVDIGTAMPWTNLTNLGVLELGGAQFEYKEIVAGLATLKRTLRNLILRHVRLKSKGEWISLIRFFRTDMDLAEFEIWEPADGEGGLCFRNLKGKCYQPYRAWRVKKQLPENLDKYLADLKETKMHRLGTEGCQYHGW